MPVNAYLSRSNDDESNDENDFEKNDIWHVLMLEEGSCINYKLNKIISNNKYTLNIEDKYNN